MAAFLEEKVENIDAAYYVDDDHAQPHYYHGNVRSKASEWRFQEGAA
jgi:hypothetical protein